MTSLNLRQTFGGSASLSVGGSASLSDFRTPTPSLSTSSREESSLASLIPFPVHQSTGVSKPSKRLNDEFLRLVMAMGPELVRLISLAAEEALRKHYSAEGLKHHPEPGAVRNEIQRELQARFEAEPLEDGVTHSAQRTVSEVLQKYPEAKEWLEQLLNDSQYKHRVALLRCVGRMPSHLVGDWGIAIASQMLKSDDIEVRDAAICALELWATPEAGEVLRAHNEPDPWLAEYAASVLKYF